MEHLLKKVRQVLAYNADILELDNSIKDILTGFTDFDKSTKLLLKSNRIGSEKLKDINNIRNEFNILELKLENLRKFLKGLR